MTTFGVTDTGFVPMRQPDAFAEIADKLRDISGGSIDLSVESVEGIFSGIAAERIAKIYEVLELLAGMLDANNASGVLLDALCALTLTFRRDATFSVVSLLLSGDDGTTVGIDSLVSDGSTANQFKTLAGAALEEVDAWDTDEEYELGDLVTNDGNVYYCRSPGSDAAGAPVHTERHDAEQLQLIFDTVGADAAQYIWIWLGAGDAVATANARAINSGPVFVAAQNIDTIDTPLAGWSGVFNPLDVTAGAAVQGDESLRLARQDELAALGTSPPDALRGRLLRVGEGTANPVTAATVFRNIDDLTDGDGIPPHAIEAMVMGGEEQDIRNAIWAAHAGGIKTHGNVSGFITDSEGNEQLIKFSRPTQINIYVAAEIVKDPKSYPANGDALVKAAIVAYGLKQKKTGKDAVAWAIGSALKDIPGIIDVLIKVGTAPAPSSSATIAINLRQIAIYDTSRITVATEDGEP